MGKTNPGKIFDFQSLWGCFGLTFFVYIFMVFGIYLLFVAPFGEYKCEYIYGDGLIYPMNPNERLNYNDWIDTLYEKKIVKGRIIKTNKRTSFGSEPTVVLKVNGEKIYKDQSVESHKRPTNQKTVTDDFQPIMEEYNLIVPKKSVSSIISIVDIIILFIIIVPIVLVIMKKINNVSQNSVRYLAGTEDKYDKPSKQKKTGFTKK